MSHLNKQFGAKVRHFRMSAGITQADLAERLDVTTEMVGKMERGTTGASFATIEKICGVFDISAGSLFPTSFADTSDELEELLVNLSKLKPTELRWAKDVLALILNRPE